MKNILLAFLAVVYLNCNAQNRLMKLVDTSDSTIYSTITQSVFDNDGSILHIGNLYNCPWQNFIAKTTKTGELKYIHQQNSLPGRLTFAKNGGYIIYDGRHNFIYTNDLFLAKINGWNYTFNNNGSLSVNSFIELYENNWAMCGNNNFGGSNGYEGYSGFIVKMDTSSTRSSYWAKKYTPQYVNPLSHLSTIGLVYIDNEYYTTIRVKENFNPQVTFSIVKLDSSGNPIESFLLDTVGQIGSDFYFYNSIISLVKNRDSIVLSALCSNKLTDTNYREALFIGKFHPDSRRINGHLYTLHNYNFLNITSLYTQDSNYYSFSLKPATVKENPNNYTYLINKSFLVIINNDTIKYCKRIIADSTFTTNSVLYRNDTAYLSGTINRNMQTAFYSYIKLDTSNIYHCDVTDSVMFDTYTEKQLSNGYIPLVSVPNTYYYNYTINGYGAGDSSLSFVFVCGDSLPTNINTINQYTKNSLSIYPNPSTGTINIHSAANIDKIVVHDLTGHILKEINFEQQVYNTTITLPGSVSGIVFCTTYTKDKVVTKKIFVLNDQ